MEKYDNILQQCPDNVTLEQVQELYSKFNGNVVDILSNVWNIDNIPIKNQSYDENHDNKEKWKNIRDICSSYEEEMNKFMSTANTANTTQAQTVELDPANNVIQS